ncbi:ABC transporter permease [Streptomyces sp. NPDC057580]|uniref:ABC transporter permease n=1 Tax=Streptomyces sp. NPDC057580 TaxID=3346173 RepID=UPI0036A17BAC
MSVRTTSLPGPASPSAEVSKPRRHLPRDLERFGILIAVVLLGAAFATLLPGVFLSASNLKTIITSQAVMLILALGVTIPLRAHYFDLSVPMTMVIASSLVAVITKGGGSLSLAVAAALGIALIVGAVNALLVVYIGVDSFIATLGTGSVLTGITFALTNTEVVTGVPREFSAVFTTEVFGISATAWYAWLLAAIIWVMFQYTPYGRLLLFVGGNPHAAFLAGISTKRIATGAYLLVAIIGAFAGLAVTGIFGAADPTIAPSFLLLPYSAAFLGAAAFQLGRFNVAGTVTALYLLAVGVNGLQLLGASPWVSELFNGFTLIVAVAFSRLLQRRSQRSTR